MRVCPVCRQTVARTVNNNIGIHRDSLGRDMCPTTGYPMAITEIKRRGK